ncbi:MAG: DEAD/DEAH box helicase family protein [Parachlamydiales bacterium]|nr:DEAD/DEAH box helicase family protein [Parachlamydiales bacterium]
MTQLSSEPLPPPMEESKVLNFLEPNGCVARSLKGYEPRQEQLAMTADIVNAYNNGAITLVEAGTGIGKSMAYLLPALLFASEYQERTVISTHTITLQEQLLNKDIPFLVKSLGLNVKISLVKGMNNYLCLRKLEDVQYEKGLLPEQEIFELEKIIEWSQDTEEGSKSSLPFLPTRTTWEKVGAEGDACSRVECPHYKSCFFFKARKEAQDSQILIANHHLLAVDLSSRLNSPIGSDGGILPSYRRLVVDEAHHLEDVATEHFARRVTYWDLILLLGKLGTDRKTGHSVGKINQLRQKLLEFFPVSPDQAITSLLNRVEIDLFADKIQLQEEMKVAFEAVVVFITQVMSSQVAKEETKPSELKLRMLPEFFLTPFWVHEVKPRIERLIESMRHYVETMSGIEGDLRSLKNDVLNDKTKSVRLDLQAMTSRLEKMADVLDQFIKPNTPKEIVCWMEVKPMKTMTNVHFVMAKLDVSEELSQTLFSQMSTAVLCSATLASHRQFDFVRKRLGIDIGMKRSVVERIYDSPFNYKHQALLAVPTDMPNPTDIKFNQAATEQIAQTIEACRGQAFVLFTSFAMMRSCFFSLKQRLQNGQFPLFLQGDEPRQILLEKFKKTRNAVLFGTDSFWEGVDVVGEALRCVIIVKLPFRVPTEPLIQARTQAIVESGGDPFMEYTLPNAIVKFKQGFGRLIRNRNDRGCIVCLDPRLIKKGYGRMFLKSLPDCKTYFGEKTSLIEEVAKFYKKKAR